MNVVPIPVRSFSQIHYLPLDLIRKNPYQPRKTFDDRALYELSESVKRYGVIQPITVRSTGGGAYEIVAGERRFRAAKMAGLAKIPAVVSNMDDRDSAVIAVIENLQREDLNFVEEAESFVKLMEEFDFTQEALAKQVGKSQSTIANKVRLLRLPPYILAALIQHNLSERHGRALLSLPSEALQRGVLDKIISDNLTVKNAETLVTKTLSDNEISKKAGRKKMMLKLKDVKIFVNTLKQSLNLMERAGFKAELDMDENEDGYEFRIRIGAVKE